MHCKDTTKTSLFQAFPEGGITWREYLGEDVTYGAISYG
jgi:hypothetical protein